VPFATNRFLIVIALTLLAAGARGELKVSTDFEGGSARVED